MKDDKLQEMALIDEMKRRNRRRLVGAVVLAVCAVVFVPMLLEKEPAPLGDNVEIVIPPVIGTKLPDTPPPEPVVPPSEVAPKETPAEPPKEMPKETPKETPKKLPSTVAFAKGTYSVQLAAFTDDKGANAMVNRVKQVGYPAYNEPTDTTRGMAWRVRVGPYKTREDAAMVRNHLKKDSYDGMVVPAR
ncbi:MAG: SPOR domain-containing protein [Burkholderiales bacterium]|jgi:cell division septation protein DedD|nr:SPOR domain-containing protein [Burkholderiales bacterium]